MEVGGQSTQDHLPDDRPEAQVTWPLVPIVQMGPTEAPRASSHRPACVPAYSVYVLSLALRSELFLFCREEQGLKGLTDLPKVLWPGSGGRIRTQAQPSLKSDQVAPYSNSP